METEHVKNVKIVCDPLWGLIDITDYLPMIDVPPFQALGFKYQLGVTNILFPSATHTRKQHSFGAFRRTQELADRWLHWGMITKNEAHMLIAFALWHDIGHGPFSHVVEAVTRELYGRDHDQNGAIIIDSLQDAVGAVGIDFAEFKKFFTHENPLYRGVHDKNLGAEKLDYLARDAYYTLGEIPGVEYLARYTYFIDGEIMIDEKAIDQAKAIQEFYVKMFKNVYLRKNSAIAQRLVQKMTAELLRNSPMHENDFWALTDFGLMGLFETSGSPALQSLYRRFLDRNLPRTAIEFRGKQFTLSATDTKPLRIMGLSETEMQRISDADEFITPSKLEAVESEVEKLVGLPAGSIVIVPPFSPERFVPQDIKIYMRGGKAANMSDYYADHFKALEEEGRAYASLRICTFEEHRKVLSDPKVAAKVQDYLISSIAVAA
ncbi:MAG: HD domain-containing protein [bacterium]|nr:HD domain-containing protein [bacterium]